MNKEIEVPYKELEDILDELKSLVKNRVKSKDEKKELWIQKIEKGIHEIEEKLEKLKDLDTDVTINTGLKKRLVSLDPRIQKVINEVQDTSDNFVTYLMGQIDLDPSVSAEELLQIVKNRKKSSVDISDVVLGFLKNA